MPFGKKKNPLGPDLNAAEANAAAAKAGKKAPGAAKGSPFKLGKIGKGAAKGKPFGKK